VLDKFFCAVVQPGSKEVKRCLADRFLPEARPDAVEDELDGQGSKQHAERASENLRAGLPEAPHDTE
jgi:hypothetical protein